MNQTDIFGDIGGEPDVMSFPGGKMVACFSVAINGYCQGEEDKPAPARKPCKKRGGVVDRQPKC